MLTTILCKLNLLDINNTYQVAQVLSYKGLLLKDAKIWELCPDLGFVFQAQCLPDGFGNGQWSAFPSCECKSIKWRVARKTICLFFIVDGINDIWFI